MIPELTKLQIDNYVNEGIPPGSFVRAVLTNNLKESMIFADSENRAAMHDIVMYLYNRIPLLCQGSDEKYINWMNMHAQRKMELNNEKK